MAQMKARELREKTVQDLMQQESTLREQLFKLRFQNATGQAENPQMIWVVRKELARVLTVIREKNVADESSGGRA
jgi:large subunit ribosomal protein L29